MKTLVDLESPKLVVALHEAKRTAPDDQLQLLSEAALHIQVLQSCKDTDQEMIKDLETTLAALRERVDFTDTADARARQAEMKANYEHACWRNAQNELLEWQRYALRQEDRANRWRKCSKYLLTLYLPALGAAIFFAVWR